MLLRTDKVQGLRGPPSNDPHIKWSLEHAENGGEIILMHFVQAKTRRDND